MRNRVIGLLLLFGFFCFPGIATSSTGTEKEIGVVLDHFHQAATEADGEVYFGLLTDDAIFLGTDVTERWSIEQFKAFAEPYFSKGKGWTYVVKDRHVTVLPAGVVARFDEVLHNDSYGTCRGTGVMVLKPEGWRIAQYSLSIPIPNEVAGDVVRLIKESEQNSVRQEEPSQQRRSERRNSGFFREIGIGHWRFAGNRPCGGNGIRYTRSQSDGQFSL